MVMGFGRLFVTQQHITIPANGLNNAFLGIHESKLISTK
jgi:hypothetical protein